MPTYVVSALCVEAGIPKTGISATIDIWNVTDASLDIDGGSVTEVGGGVYKYSFTSWDATKSYRCIFDFTSALVGPERYIEKEISLFEGSIYTLLADLADGGRLDLLIDAIKAKTDNQPAGVPKNVALSNFPFLMVSSSNHITPATGKTVTATISKDGGSFAACSNSVTELANGVYVIDLTQTEMNASLITLKFTASDCDQRTITIKTST